MSRRPPRDILSARDILSPLEITWRLEITRGGLEITCSAPLVSLPSVGYTGDGGAEEYDSEQIVFLFFPNSVYFGLFPNTTPLKNLLTGLFHAYLVRHLEAVSNYLERPQVISSPG